jgi:hypothetical protein
VAVAGCAGQVALALRSLAGTFPPVPERLDKGQMRLAV